MQIKIKLTELSSALVVPEFTPDKSSLPTGKRYKPPNKMEAARRANLAASSASKATPARVAPAKP